MKESLAQGFKVEYHPAVELLRLFLEKYEKMEPQDRAIIAKAIALLSQPPLIHTT